MHYASVHFSRVSVSFCTSVPPSLFALPQALHASHLFHRMAWPAGEKKESSLPPSISYKSPLLIHHAKRLESHPHLCTCIQYSHNDKSREREPASQPNMQIPPFHRTHIPQSHHLPLPLHNPIPFSFDCDSNLLLTSHQHPSARASSTACSSCSTPPCTSPCSWCSRSIRPMTGRSRGSGCSGRSSVR
jgi:hypothetical protein